MDDVTNYRENNTKPLEEQRFTIEVSWEELCAIVALAQNPHPNYMNHYQNERIFEVIFRRGSSMRNYVMEKNRDLDDDSPL